MSLLCLNIPFLPLLQCSWGWSASAYNEKNPYKSSEIITLLLLVLPIKQKQGSNSLEKGKFANNGAPCCKNPFLQHLQPQKPLKGKCMRCSLKCHITKHFCTENIEISFWGHEHAKPASWSFKTPYLLWHGPASLPNRCAVCYSPCCSCPLCCRPAGPVCTGLCHSSASSRRSPARCYCTAPASHR